MRVCAFAVASFSSGKPPGSDIRPSTDSEHSASLFPQFRVREGPQIRAKIGNKPPPGASGMGKQGLKVICLTSLLRSRPRPSLEIRHGGRIPPRGSHRLSARPEPRQRHRYGYGQEKQAPKTASNRRNEKQPVASIYSAWICCWGRSGKPQSRLAKVSTTIEGLNKTSLIKFKIPCG